MPLDEAMPEEEGVESPLEEVSDEELLAELKKRGLDEEMMMEEELPEEDEEEFDEEL